MTHFFDIIILLLAVLIIFTKLKNILGTRPDEISKATPLSEESAAKIFDIIMQENEKNAKKQKSPENLTPLEDMNPVEQALLNIPDFNRDSFLNGARRAFEIIITAFANADTEMLKSLVTPKLVKKFEEILNQRKSDGITAETDLIGFNNVEITDAKISKSNLAKITVKFITEQINLLKDKHNKVIEGDENFIQNITDIWTFERSLDSSNPNWLLTSTKK